jgi:two-component system OmpR family response regulator
MIEILMIEDDTEIASLLTDFLSEHNISITNYESPELGMSALNLKKYDLVILDLSLPELDGTEVCKLIRAKSNIPIIISSARSDIDDKTICFTYGADDYIPKPYNPKELVLRINSILRRDRQHDIKKEDKQKIFTYDDDKLEIYKNAKAISFTNAEYNIMKYFIKKAGYSVNREELLVNVDSIKYESTLKSIDVLISRIRGKIEDDPKHPKYIISIRGIGYKLINEDQ